MNRNVRVIIKVVVTSLCLIIVGIGLYLLAGKTVTNHFLADFNYAVVSGQTKLDPNKNIVIPDNDSSVQDESQSSAQTSDDNPQPASQTPVSQTPMEEEEWSAPVVGEQYAILSCESAELEVPVYVGDTDEILKKGAGQSVHSMFPGQGGTTLIGGHDTTFFAPLEKMKENDEVILNTTYGTYTYKVTDKRIIKGSDIDIDSDEEKLIMYTCYPFGEILSDRDQKIIFECSLVDGSSIGGASNE